jgi:Putative peptidoglycan binding domain
MSFGNDVVALAKTHLGEKYVLGASAKFLQPDFKGPWDCAEFVSWVIFQVSNEKVLLGCVPRDPARADAYTGYWVDDAKKYGLIISITDALRTAGAVLLRSPVGKPHGHIAISLGDGKKTVEAYDTAHGVISGPAAPATRGWDFGVRIPDPGEWASLTKKASKPNNWFFRPTASNTPDPRVETIETALQRKGAKIATTTGRFTPKLAKTVAKFQQQKGLVVDGMVGKQTAKALDLDWEAEAAPSGIFNDKYGIYFDSLVPGGFFSHDPDDLKVRRSIRTNNPGALNFSTWQKSVRGYVGITPADKSPNHNRTTIYRTPEHGIAAWYILLADRYRFGAAGRFSLEGLAKKYAGSGANAADVSTYTKGWSKASGGALTPTSVFHLRSTDELLQLGKAMFAHEIGKASPVSDAQIEFGIDHQRDGSMPL